MSILFPEMLVKRNYALEANPPVGDHHLTNGGSNLAWAIMTLHALLFLGVLGWAFTTSPLRRVFHYFSLLILFVATIYYFILASNLGSSVIQHHRMGTVVDSFAYRMGSTRQIFYARWVGYTINFTLIVVALLLLSTVGWASILLTAALTLAWGSLYLMGMFVASSFKWGFLVFAIVANLLIAWQLLGNARGWASRVDTAMHKSYSTLAAYIVGLMFLYAIAWGVSEGSHRISNNREMVFYAVLDVLSQGVFAIMLLVTTRSLDFDFLRLGRAEHGRVRLGTEKHHNNAAHHGDGAGTVPVADTRV